MEHRKKIFHLVILVVGILFFINSSSVAYGNETVDPLQSPVDSIPLTNVFREPITTKYGKPTLLEEGKVLQITQAVGSWFGQNGAIWSKNKLDLTKDFALRSYIYLGDSGTEAGDGITFTLQNDPNMGTSNETKVIGNSGAGIAVYYVGYFDNYVKNCLVLEFDTFYNGDGHDENLRNSNDNRGHIAFVRPTNKWSDVMAHYNVVYPSEPLSNGKWRMLDITWNAKTERLYYELEGIGSKSVGMSTFGGISKVFGDSKVYWGFTGSTGDNFADNRIAITQLPGSIAQKLQLYNEISEMGPDTNITGHERDTIEITDTIVMDATSIMNTPNMKIEIDLPEGLNYITDSLFLDGRKVESSEMTVNGNQLIIDDLHFTQADKAYTLKFRAEVTANQAGTRLPTIIKITDAEDEELSISNEAVVSIPRLGNVWVYYVDADGKNIAEPKQIRAEVGTSFAEEPIEIANYKYDRTEGNATGTVTEADQSVSFCYKKKMADIKVNFVDEKNEPLNDPILIREQVGSEVDLTDNQEIKEVLQRLSDNYYSLPRSGRPLNESGITINEMGTEVFYRLQGMLALAQAPDVIDFGRITYDAHNKAVTNPTFDSPLKVIDKRAEPTDWYVTVSLKTALTNTENGHEISEAIRYQRRGREYTLNDEDQVIYQKYAGGDFTISSEWGEDTDGPKLIANGKELSNIGSYQGEIIWKLMAGNPDNP